MNISEKRDSIIAKALAFQKELMEDINNMYNEILVNTTNVQAAKEFIDEMDSTIIDTLEYQDGALMEFYISISEEVQENFTDAHAIKVS